jgi:hypothetical protein
LVEEQIKAWLEGKKEDWHTFNPHHSIALHLKLGDIRRLETALYTQQLQTALTEANDCRRMIFSIRIQTDKGRFNQKLQQRVDRGCGIIWDGMRTLPYRNQQIATAIIHFAFMTCLHEKHPTMIVTLCCRARYWLR